MVPTGRQVGTTWSLGEGLCRFGPFEFELSTGELRKHGLRLRIQEQPSRVLAALLEHPGELVTREDLRQRLWPSDTFVDFERSLNAAVAKLRQTLADAAEHPHYVETVARHGYRFIAPVEAVRRNGREINGDGQSAAQPAPIRRKPSTRVWLGATASLMIVAAFVAGYLVRRAPAASESTSVRFLISPPHANRIANDGSKILSGGPDKSVSVSPDGRTVVFAAIDDSGPSVLWVRPLASETAQRLENTDGALYPFWSPDSENIGFFTQGKLKRVSAHGGPPVTICDAPNADSGAWSRDNVILFSSNELYRVPASGGAVTQVTRLDKNRGEIYHSLPQFLTGGRNFVFWAAVYASGQYPSFESAVFLGSLDSSARKRLFSTRGRALFAAPDHLLFLRGGLLLAQKFDMKRSQLIGEPVPVAENVSAPPGTIAAFSVSQNGVLSYRVLKTRPKALLASYNRDGRRLATVGEPGRLLQIVLSPDEKMAALTILRSEEFRNYNIWLLRLDTEVLSQLTFGERDADPVWSPDSKTIFYNASQKSGPGQDLVQLTLGERSPRLLYTDGRGNKSEAWSPDGRFLVYRRDEAAVFTLAADGHGKPLALLDSSLLKTRFSFSPDGRRLAYVESESPLFSPRDRRWRVFVADFPSMSGTRQVSAGSGCTPQWRGDGREMFYMGEHGEIMSVAIKPGTSFELGSPKTLFRPPVGNGEFCFGNYAVSRDGQRFLIIESPPQSESQIDDRIHVVTHWDSALLR